MFTFFHFFNIFLKKSEVFMSKFSKKKTGKCQKHETNMISCLFHASYIYLFFLNKKLPKCSLFFHFFNIFLEKIEIFMSKILKRKLVNVSSIQKTYYDVCFMLLTLTSF